MKFGQNLPRNQVPEWASSYIEYKGLKKLIKAAQRAVENGQDPDLAGFSFTLDRQLENVDTFYNRKYAELSRRLRLLYDRYGMVSKMQDAMDKDERDDLMSTLLELRGTYRKLQWYGEVNRRGFAKITKKLDKKIPQSSAQNQYMSTKVDPKAFATNNKLTLDMRGINEWLSSLGPVKAADDASSTKSGSSHSLRRMASRGSLKIPSATLDAMDQAVRQDNATALFELLTSGVSNAVSEPQKNNVLLEFLQRSISARSLACVEAILQRVNTLEQDDDMNKRNCLHRTVIAIGRARALEMSTKAEGLAENPKAASFINAAQAPVRAPSSLKIEERDPEDDLGKDQNAQKVLLTVLDRLKSEQRTAISSKDMYGRLPLHYAAQYGLVSVCQELIRRMQDWQLFDTSDGLDSEKWQDLEGYAPLNLAVMGGHYRTTKALLLIDDAHPQADRRLTHSDYEKNGASLALATKSNFHQIVKVLVDAGVHVNYQDEQGETALHLAARYGHVECARILLSVTGTFGVNVELAEKTYGWTPLFIACVDGHLDVVKLLVEKGAHISNKDYSGWTPQEHAALRGHLAIAQYLAQFTPPPSLNSSPDISAQAYGALTNGSLEDRKSKGVSKDVVNGNGTVKAPEPVKTFGHRYLTDESMVLVSLGSMDPRKELEAVMLDDIALSDAHSTQLDTALSLVITAKHADGEATTIDLPVRENISTSPVSLSTRDPTKVKLLFDLVPTYAGSTKPIARAVALLSSIKPNIGAKRMNLQGDLSAPLVASATLDVIGTVNFNFLVISPFSHPNMSVSEDRTYWKKSATRVIGHRGLGKNMANNRSLQLGENTLDSFVAAASLGASYVEFDVQMTKDHVPVIYHDFLVSETGADVPVHSLTLEQFLALSDRANKSRRNRKDVVMDDDSNERPRPQRSYSLGATQDDDSSEAMRDRMKHTRDFKKKGFKGNTRGDFIGSQFTTLEEMFIKLPEDISFNIEMKYPMLWETVDEEMDTYAIELNSFVDTVLNMVYERTKKRNIIFSSFHPDICLLLSFKQPNFPVLFLTDAGDGGTVGDIRASSLQEAIRFASRWNLLGIVSAAKPFVLCPRLIQVVKSSGLVCVSYGTDNNDPLNAKLQAQEGIDAVIVDSVARVRKGLTEGQDGAETLTPAFAGTPRVMSTENLAVR